jgi:hypothetical protein
LQVRNAGVYCIKTSNYDIPEYNFARGFVWVCGCALQYSDASFDLPLRNKMALALNKPQTKQINTSRT